MTRTIEIHDMTINGKSYTGIKAIVSFIKGVHYIKWEANQKLSHTALNRLNDPDSFEAAYAIAEFHEMS